jgi:hypothetical protein
MNSIALAGIAGVAAGGMMILLSHLVLRVDMAQGARDLDRLRLFGKEYSRRESHVIGIIIHALLYGVAGVAFGSLVQAGMLAHDLPGAVMFIIVLTLAFGGIIMPLEGHGIFGSREDSWFALDLLIANAVWVILFEAILRLVV